MFLSERNVKRQLFRVKQLADQTFARAEKSEVLTDDLVNAEKRVELIKHVCTNAVKKIQAGLQGQGTDGPAIDKRLKKLPDFQLASTMLDSSSLLGDASILGSTLSICGKAESELASCLLTHEVEVEKLVIAKLQEVLDNDIPSITKLKKQLSKLTLDMDSAKARYVNATRHSIPTPGNTTKVENIKEELDDSTSKVVQCKDNLAEEMFSLLAKEHDLSQCVLHLVKSQADYHRKVLGALEGVIPNIEKVIENHSSKPVYGFPLEEHLRINERKIALPIETCVCFLMECGLEEEGLFRIAGSSSKVKKLKNAFDAGYVEMTDYVRDPHAVAGALKQYLRELPVPLVSFTLYEEWLDTARHTETDARVKAMWNVVRELPEPYYNNLRYLVKFLAKLTDLQEMNKMSPQNVAIVMGPNLMWSPNEDPATLGMNMSLANTYSSIVDVLIVYADYFFEGEEEFFVTSPRGYLAEYLSNEFPPTSADSISNGDFEEHTVNISTFLPTGGSIQPPADVDVQPISSVNNKSNSPKSCASPKLPRRMKKPAPPVPPAPTFEAPVVVVASPPVIAAPPSDRRKSSSLPERPPISERPRGHERKSSWLTSDIVSNKISVAAETESSSTATAPVQRSPVREHFVQLSSSFTASNSQQAIANSNAPQFSTFGMTSSISHNNNSNGPVLSLSVRPQPVPRPNVVAKPHGNDVIESHPIGGTVLEDCPFADEENRDADGLSSPSPVRRKSLEDPEKFGVASKLCEKDFGPSNKCKDRPPRPTNLPVQKEDTASSINERPDKLARVRSLRNCDRISEEQNTVEAVQRSKHWTNSVDRSSVRSKQNYVNICDTFGGGDSSRKDSKMDSNNERPYVASRSPTLHTEPEVHETAKESVAAGEDAVPQQLPPPERPEKFDRSKMVPPARPEKSDRLKALMDHKQEPSKSIVPSKSSSKIGSIFTSVIKEKPARPSYSPSPSSSSLSSSKNKTSKKDDVPNDDDDDGCGANGPPIETNDSTPRRRQSSYSVPPSSPGLGALKPPRPQPRPPLPPVARPRSIAIVNPEQTHL